jgi:hypothetical protein
MKKVRGGRLLSFLGVGIGLTLSGCAAHFTVPSADALLNPPPPLEETRETTLIKPDLSYESLKLGGIGLLAILTPGAPEGLRQNAAFEIFQGLRAHFPEVRIVPRSDMVDRIAAAEKMPELNVFLKNYEEQRPIDLARLKQWGEIEGVRYLFIGQIRSIDKHTESPQVSMAERSPAGKVTVFSSGPSHFPEEVRKRVSLSGELWDSHCGKAVWMGKSDTAVAEVSDRERVRVEDVFIAAGRNLTEALSRAIKEKKEAGAVSDC